jgi:hypothetical protein
LIAQSIALLRILLSSTALNIPTGPIHQQLIQTSLYGSHPRGNALPEPLVVTQLLGLNALDNALST